MKKLLALIVSMLIVLSLAACGEKAETPSPEASKDTASAAPTAGQEPSAAPTVDYPTKPVTFIVEYSAGGSSDLLSRAFCSVFQKHLGQTVNVENKPGGGGAVGATYILSQPADGYTLFYATSGVFTTLPYTQEVEYDPVNDYKYVAGFAMHDVLLVVPADSPYQTLDDYIEAAKAGPDVVAYGQSSPGGTTHMLMEEFQEKADIDLNMIAYENGAAEITAALLGGHLESAQTHPQDVMEHLKAGTLRALAIFSDERRPSMPDVPTMKECGIDIAVGVPRGIAVHKDTPDEIVAILDKAVQETLADPEYLEVATKANEADSMHYMSGSELKEMLVSMTESALPIMERLGLLPEGG